MGKTREEEVAKKSRKELVGCWRRREIRGRGDNSWKVATQQGSISPPASSGAGQVWIAPGHT